MTAQDWPIQEVAKLSGVSSRTLRHYQQIGLLEPSRVGLNGYRYYDATTLAELQTVLLLRQQGLSLGAIAKVIHGEAELLSVLKKQRDWLESEHGRISRQLNSIRNTIDAFERKETPMAENMFDGFDHTQYKAEIEERWGAQAYADSNRWWKSQSDDEKREWQQMIQQLSDDWKAMYAEGLPIEDPRVQKLAERQHRWLEQMPAVPKNETGGLLKEYFIGLGDMYVADPRFAKNYGGLAGAEYVRDAMKLYAERM